MKRKKTIIRPDGSKEIIEEHDEAPQMHTARQKAQQLAAKGNKGDTQLAHINNYEAMLLKKMGGAGTINPRTGLKQYYTDPSNGKEYGSYTDYLNSFKTAPEVVPTETPTPQTPGNFDLPLDLAPYSESQSQSGGQNTSNALGVNQSTNQSNQGSFSLGTNQAQNTSNQGSQNQSTQNAQNTASNTAQNTAFNQAQNTAQQQAQNTSQQQAQNTNLSQAQNTNLSQAQNTAQNQGITMGQQGAFNTGAQGSENMAVNNSFTNSINYSGLDPAARQSLSNAIMPQLQNVATKMPEQYDIYTQEALGTYQMMLNNALKKQIPQTIANLANRGIISSADGTKILAQVMSDAAIAASDKGYQTAMQAALAKATTVPDMLAKIASLGQYTSGGSVGGATGMSGGTSFGNTLGTSYGSNLGLNTGTAQGTSLGVGQGTSFGFGQGTSSGFGQGTSSGTSQGTSLGGSQGTSMGQSQGTSSGQATGSSFGNAQGTSSGMNQAGSFGSSAGQSTGLNMSGSQGTNFANSQAYQTDPTVMYRAAFDAIKNMIPEQGG